MTTYDIYKPSGIEWIGEIPEHWEVKKLKWIISDKLKYGANEIAELDDPNLPRYIRITDFGEDGKLKDDTFKSLPNEIAKDYLLDEGDILFARSGATVGKTFQFKDYKGFACFAGYLIRAKPNKEVLNSDFMYFYTKSWGYESWKNSIFNQATIQNIGADKYAYLEFIIPSYTEQTSIATYLDRKTAEIDHIIANKQKLIALYEEEKQTIINQAVTRGVNKRVKLKPSGVEWLGDIPEHWEVMKLKWISKVRYGLGQPPKEKSDGLPIIRATNVFRGRIDTNNLVFVDPDDVPYDRDPILKENDIIVVRSGAYTADSAIIPKKFEGSVTGYDMVVRCDSKVNPVFISKCLLSNYVLRIQLLAHTLRAAQPHLNREELNETIILFPPIVEQHTIVAHIETECSRLDTLIEKFKKQIELFQEYRTTLISEVVTGKVKV